MIKRLEGEPKADDYGMRIRRRPSESALLSYVPSAYKMLACHEAIRIGREFQTSEGVDGERDFEPGGHQPTGKLFRWKVVAINTWHFTAAFISPRTKANGQRRSFTYTDVLTGRVHLC